MKLLTLHSDFVEFTPLSKALKDAEPVEKGVKTRVEECLVAFVSAEKGDSPDSPERAAREVAEVARQVKAKRVVVYPWVHLTPNPASPAAALESIKRLASILSKDFEVVRAPFGWYKSFDIRCKGHPLAELSREVRPAEKAVVSESLKREEKIERDYYIFTPEGELVPAAEFDFSSFPELKKLCDYEIQKVRAYAAEPPHLRLMREHAIASHEPGSDVGNLRWYPNGRLIKKLLERHVSDMCVSYGAMEVETPIMYDFEHPALKKYLNRFPARQYVVESEGREFFLRFSACFGQFLLSHDATVSHHSLPLRMFELTKYSFRREQSGEVAGLRRLRAFTMPDMHTVCADIPQAKGEFEAQFAECLEWMEDLSLPFEAAFRIQRDFFNANKSWYLSLAKKLGKPFFVEMFSERYAYFITKFEFNFIDNLDKASALSTVQIDIENADTYDLTFVASDGSRKRPVLLHASFSGSTDRCVYALLENEARRAKQGKKPSFPLWLSPTQVRVVPIADAQLHFAREATELIRSSGVRADLDDRSETLQKKIREAEKEWIPFIAVVGEREVAARSLSVRIRSTGENKSLSPEQLASLVRNECAGKPFEPLSLPFELSKRPIF